MNSEESMGVWGDFFEEPDVKSNLSISNATRSPVYIPFSRISNFNLDIAEQLLEEPEEQIKAAEVVFHSEYEDSGKLKIHILIVICSYIFFHIEIIIYSTTTTRSMILNCPKCGKEWDYGGKCSVYATCPNCIRKIKIIPIIQKTYPSVCPHCQYAWESRVTQPKSCPRCKQRQDSPYNIRENPKNINS